MTPILCLATAIFFEAGNQPLEGKYAVAAVIMNRVESRHYPNDICAVVDQRAQFSFTNDGKSDDMFAYLGYYDKIAAHRSLAIAENVVAGYNPVDIQATHYHADYVTPYWASSLTLEVVIGAHIFYTN